MRARSVPTPIVTKSWKDVQANIGQFNNLFKGDMIIVDNNDADEDVFKSVWKRVRGLLGRKVKNKRAQDWIAREMQKKRRK